MQLHFNTVSEAGLPGPKWKKTFDQYWPAYLAWLNAKGAAYVPDLHTSQAALKKYMPKMWPTYKRLCELSNADPVAARFLTGFQPPSYISACSQAVINEKTVQLVRNYDYHPDLMEGTLLLSAWHGKKVIATSDCLIGVVDGMNEDGLAISLTFGGRKEVGVGFGIPFILRYVLEFCGNVQEAVQALCSIPSHMSYNVTVVDRKGACKTLFLSPDRNPVITDAAFTTNHQGRVDWPENAVFNKTIERSDYLKELMDGQSPDANEMSDAFLRPPLYNTQYDQGFGTLYTAVYNPSERTIKIRWPQQDIQVSFDNFKEQYKLIEFNCPTAISPVQPVRHVARVSKKSKQKQWYGQELAVNILDDSVVVVNTTEENKKLNNFDHRAIGRGEISWEIIADYWANVGKKYWEKWQN